MNVGETMSYVKRPFKNGRRCRCGPPMRAGAYDKWNWCAICTAIFDKTHKRCPDCNQTLRWKARSANRWGQPTLE